MDMKTLGKWLFLIGLLVAVVLALAGISNEYITLLLMLAAIFAGWFYADHEDTVGIGVRYLALAAVAGSLTEFIAIGEFLTAIFTAAVVFLGPYVLTVLVAHLIKKVF